MTRSSATEQVQVALGDVWDRAYPVVLARVGAIEGAAAELSMQHPQGKPIDAGRADAHKLAGTLGTFGLDRGTELARALERRLSAPGCAEEVAETERLVAELRSTVERARVDQPETAVHR
jgi:HPt (histidine-containing phosphotransfer) domain-containing protein